MEEISSGEWEIFSTTGPRAALKQVAGAACCDSGNTTCAAGLSCITGYCDIKRISAKRKLSMDRPKNSHMIHFLIMGTPVMS
jgi:hypothetical protein